ncbi:hypothetical protein GBA65_07555 [Rubrobacter marinus]|uniref:Uncharacterized protein n=1 Tax=Rubrobacter marinus TaxID=2653852 RepID=A0A6G8PW37_9ACTN|nr:hypothetical protein [Rubrobacter marinus]QIN78403.1 hypothetical protein GBA65_07555 [Rubrobacter marinus]
MGKIRVLGTWRTPTERAGGRVSDGVAKYPGERVNARDHGVVSAGPGGLRVVIALGQEYNVYGEAFASAILSYRPRAVVEHVPPEELDGAVARLEPLLVITDSVGDAADASVLARAEISAEPAEPSRFVVGGRSGRSSTRRLGTCSPSWTIPREP